MTEGDNKLKQNNSDLWDYMELNNHKRTNHNRDREKKENKIWQKTFTKKTNSTRKWMFRWFGVAINLTVLKSLNFTQKTSLILDIGSKGKTQNRINYNKYSRNTY